MSERGTIQIDPARLVRLLAVLAVVLIVVSVAGQVVKFFFGHARLLGVVPEFDLGGENNIPTYFSSALLLAVAVIAALVARIEGIGSRWGWHWIGLAAVFLFLSLDESASLHERTIVPLRVLLGVGGWLYFTWVIPAFVLLLGFLAIYWRFFRALPDAIRRWVLLAGVLYIGGALGVELIGGQYVGLYGRDTFAYNVITTVEETLEIAGILLLLHGLGRYLADRHPVIEIRVGETGVGS